jgi:hypothetical protein
MKMTRPILCIALSGLLSALSANATPYASGITNNGSGTMTFYLNEGGGNVTITYEDSSLNANYNGTTTGTNLAAGPYTFAMGSHTSYTISVFKTGSGAPSLITNSPAFTPRGVAVNTRPASPYFGRVYAAASGAGGLYVLNGDMSFTYPAVRAAGVSWANNGLSPYRLSITPDDYLMVGDASSANAGVFRIDPTVTTSKVFLSTPAGVGEANGIAAGVFGTIQSKPLILGNRSTGPVTLYQVDGDLSPTGGNGYNSLLGYTNITLANTPWTNPPTILGPDIGVQLASESLGDNEYPGLSQGGPSNYLYASTYRNNLSNPQIQIYDPTNLNQIWNSFYNGGGADYFLTTSGGNTQGIIDSGVSSDGRYIAGLTIDNWFVIAPMTNGIPDTGNLFLSTPTSYTGNGRGMAWDAADNLYLSSSGIGLVQSWTLGLTTTANTTGNSNGSTGFTLSLPANSVNVVAVTNIASQGGSDGTVGTPVLGSFLITRTNANNNYSSPVTVFFTLGGTATNGVYTVLPSGISPAVAGSIVLPAGVISTNITIIPTTNNVPRLTTTVTLTLKGGPTYSTALPVSDTVTIINTSTNQLVLSAGAPSMYKAFSNDYASATITRLGDTNAPSYTVPASAFTYTGTAVANTDFTPVPAMTFNPGDVTHAAQIHPLSNGVPPIDVANAVYVGNKTVTVTINSAAGVGYITTSNSTALTLIDNATIPNGVVLLNDALTNVNDSTNWTITYGTSDLSPQFIANYNVAFGYDLTANNPNAAANGLIGLPPSGSSNALRINCNQNANPGAEGGVNVYYTNKLFKGNFAVRFYMNAVEGYGLYQEGGPLFGINHNGIESNWWESSGPPPATGFAPGAYASDGVWYWMDSAPGDAASDYIEFTGIGPLPNTGWTEPATASYTSFATAFKDPNVYTTYISGTSTSTSGLPANASTLDAKVPANGANDWVDVEIDQINSVVTLMMNKTVIFTYNNTTTFTNGYIMLGYNSPFAGVYGQALNTPDQAAYFSDLRVVELGPDIVTMPSSLTVGAGTNATFAVTTAYSSSSVTNQLYTAGGTAVGSPIVVAAPGGKATLTMTGPTPGSNGNYMVVVSDVSGSVTSSVVSLTVIAPPVITVQPLNVTTNAGGTATFTLLLNNIAGTAPFTFQWYSNNVALTNGGAVSGVTTNTLTITNVNASDVASYTVTVTNFAGATTSAPVSLSLGTASPHISGVSLAGGNVVIQFTTPNPSDTTNSYNLQNSTNLASSPHAGFTNVTATWSGTNGTFTVQIPTNAAAGSYYRLQHQ